MASSSMPTPAELEKWRNQNLFGNFQRHLSAIRSMYNSTEHLDIQAAVDQIPSMLLTNMCTLACLIGMGYGDPDIRAKVIAKMVETRLAS